MAYELHYTRKLTRNDGTEEKPNIVEYFQDESVFATDADYDVQMAFAKEHSYNGEVIPEEVSDPENPVSPGVDPSVWDDMAAAIAEGVNDV